MNANFKFLTIEMNVAPLKTAITILILCLLATAHASREILTKTRREVIEARHGAVASDDRRCSEVGRDVLMEGGHAVDAAVAVALCLGVVSPASSGIGGGAFMIVRSKTGQSQAFDMRETAPKLASENMYSGNAALKASGSLSVGVPGELAGLYEAWKQYGKLPWKRLVNPSVKLARNGFKVSPYLYMQMTRTESGIKADKGLSQIFTSKRKLLQPGDICFNKMLAKTLSEVSKSGLSSFYNGSIGMNLVRDVQKGGGILSLKDLQSYRVRIRKPIVTDVMGLKILGMPPPSFGGVAMALILNILAQYELPKGDVGTLGIHREIETLKHAFAVRMNLGDPDFVNITNVVSDMLSPKFAENLKKTIYDNMTFGPSHYGGRWNIIHDHGTSHVSIVDEERNAVSMTNTINSYFGALFLSPSTGIVLNNEMDDFSVPSKNRSANVPPPAPLNFICPDKRPLSSMSPTIVLQSERLRAVVGASGGAFIIAGTAEVFLNYFIKGMDPFSSVMAPRYYHQLIPNVVQYENWTTVSGDHFELPLETRRVLQSKGHALHALAGGTISQLIVDEECLDPSKSPKLVAVSDPRKGGFPAGY